MTIYRYDLGELESTAGNLITLAREFESAASIRESAEGAMGYDSLRNAIGDFTGNWENNRDKQVEAINGAASVLVSICTNYTAFDQDAVDILYEGQ